MKTRIYSVLCMCRMSWAALIVGLAAILLTQAVVAQQETPDETGKTKEFFFAESPSPGRFIRTVQQHFGLDWDEIVTIPVGPYGSIPAMRLETSDPMDVIRLYNRLAEENPDMGKWVVEGNIAKPSAVVLVSDRSRLAKGSEIKMKAFPLRGIPRDDWYRLEAVTYSIGQDVARRVGTPEVRQYVELLDDFDLGILVAQGSEEFIEFIDSLLTAHRDNLQIGTGGGSKIDGGNSSESKASLLEEGFPDRQVRPRSNSIESPASNQPTRK